jgi:V8-like Glu-specific endopeptidase
MQNAQSLILKTVEELLSDGEIEKALDILLELEEQTQVGIRRDLINQSGNFKQAKKMYQNDEIDSVEYRRASAKVRNTLQDLIKDIPRKMAQNAQIQGLKSFQFEVPDNDHLEKIIGDKSSILRINWLEKALNASKAVCRVVCADGSRGTGFLTKDGYVFTNNHVIPSAKEAATATLEFNYEVDGNGNIKNRVVYQLDPKDAAFSPKDQYDFARVRVIDRSDAPLKQWGYVEFETEAIPAVGDPVTIIQHPKGEDKQIALNANEVLGQLYQHLYYTTDTEPGSSGSPVFNKDWKVVAIHHAGKTQAEGGFVVNARGDRMGANRGILFRDIFNLLRTGQTTAGNANTGASAETYRPEPTPTPPVAPPPAEPYVAPVARPQEETAPVQPAVPTPTPVQPVRPTPPPPAAVPKFVILYALEDDHYAKMLNRHLNVLKITKKIRVYNVQEASVGLDPIQEAQSELADADYMVVLLSVNLLNSPEWFEIAYNALRDGRRIIPVKITNVDMDGIGFEKLRSLPTGNRSLADFPNPDAAYTDIVGEFRKLL